MKTECSHCGKEYNCLPYKAKQPLHYCSRGCLHDSMRKTKSVECLFCGTPVQGNASRIRSDKTFCSRECFNGWRGRNPKRVRFGSGITPAQRKIYGGSCLICGFDRVVELCHLIPAAIGGNIHPYNIVPLCPNHHTLMDKSLLTTDEEALLDNHLIRAWASPLTAQFPETSDAPSGAPAPSVPGNQTD